MISLIKELIFPQCCSHCEQPLKGDEALFCPFCWQLMEPSQASCQAPWKELNRGYPWAYIKGIAAIMLWHWIQQGHEYRPCCHYLPSDCREERLFNKKLCRCFDKLLQKAAMPYRSQQLYIGWKGGKANGAFTFLA